MKKIIKLTLLGGIKVKILEGNILNMKLKKIVVKENLKEELAMVILMEQGYIGIITPQADLLV